MVGARPKTVVTANGSEWIAKFPARKDPVNAPLVERATLELAREAALDVPRTGLEILVDGRQVMLIERFGHWASDGKCEIIRSRHKVNHSLLSRDVRAPEEQHI